MNDIVWVTGVAGFTGRYLIEYLNGLKKRPQIIGFDIANNPPSNLDDYHLVDLQKSNALPNLIKKNPPKWIIHLAGLMPPSEEGLMWKINVGCTISLLASLHESDLKDVRFLGIGSAAEYFPSVSGYFTEISPCGNRGSYGQCKWAQSSVTLAMGKQLSIHTMIARPFNLIGPGLTENLVAGSLCKQFSKKQPSIINVGNVYSERDFIDVRDAVPAYWDIVTQGHKLEIYNVCTSKSVSIKEISDLFSNATSNKHTVVIDESKFKEHDINRVYGSYEKLNNLSGWHPRIKLEESIHDMLSNEIMHEKI